MGRVLLRLVMTRRYRCGRCDKKSVHLIYKISCHNKMGLLYRCRCLGVDCGVGLGLGTWVGDGVGVGRVCFGLGVGVGLGAGLTVSCTAARLSPEMLGVNVISPV